MGDAGELLEGRTFPRRVLLGAAVGAAGIALTNALGRIEDGVMDMHYGDSSVEIVLPNAASFARWPANASAASSGWNDSRGQYFVDCLREYGIYHKDFPSAYYAYGGQNISVDSIGSCTQQFVDKLQPRELDIHGASEGGIITLTGALAAKRHLRLITVNDSPFDINDVRNSTAAKLAVLADKSGLYHGDIIGKMLTYLLYDVEQHGIGSLANRESWRYAWQQTWDKLDPRLTVKQLRLLEDADLWKRRDECRRIMTSSSHMIIMRTLHTDTDRVVRDLQAVEKWVALAEYCKVPYYVIDIPRQGHAPIASGIKASAARMQYALSV